MEKPRLEDLPSLVVSLQQKIDSLTETVQNFMKPADDAPVWFDVQGLREYIPSHPSIQTIYGWCSTGVIPYHKAGTNGKQNIFLKSEIDEWLLTRVRKSDAMLAQEAAEYVKSKRNG